MAHAILSPSSASRWLSCTPSARLEQSFPDSSGMAAAEGTLAHNLGELILRKYFWLIKDQEYNHCLTLIKCDPLYNEDLQSHAEAYAAFVIEHFESAKLTTKDALIFIEKSLDLTDFVPEGFGTGDAVIIADGTMKIIDLKYGKGVSVSCVKNKQMMLYALGALKEFDYMYDVNNVEMIIYQPRLDNISSYEMTAADLMQWGTTELIPKAKLAFEGKGEFCPGDHCRFCKVKPQCKALANQQLELAKYDFQESVLLTDAEIADVLGRADTFSSWIKSVEDYAYSEAVNNNKKWPGWKLVEGRSNRVYADQQKVADKLLSEGFDEETIYTKSLLGITAMEKVITKKTFETVLTGLVIKPQGKPALVPENDKRPEYKSADSAKNDFK